MTEEKYLCPGGCGKETPRLSGPLKREPSPVPQRAEFCSYRCWLRYREATGQNDWHREGAG